MSDSKERIEEREEKVEEKVKSETVGDVLEANGEKLEGDIADQQYIFDEDGVRIYKVTFEHLCKKFGKENLLLKPIDNKEINSSLALDAILAQVEDFGIKKETEDELKERAKVLKERAKTVAQESQKAITDFIDNIVKKYFEFIEIDITEEKAKVISSRLIYFLSAINCSAKEYGLIVELLNLMV